MRNSSISSLYWLCLMLWASSTNTVRAFFTTRSNTPKQLLLRSFVSRRTPSSSPLGSSSTSSVPDYDGNIIDDDDFSTGGYKRPAVNWYPGHIAKAERQLSETLKSVDVIVEVRDARACKATSHSKVAEWCAGKPRIVVLTHVDRIPKQSIASWKRSYETFGAGRWDGEVNAQVSNQALQIQMERIKYDKSQKPSSSQKKKKKGNTISNVENFLFVDAKMGQGIHALNRAIVKSGVHVQERRSRRGLKDRALRVGIIGYPNVGKSALINRILGRRRAKTADKPGITRSLQWIRVKTDSSKASTTKKVFELLDSPGVIPARITDQSDAFLLGACNCIGDAAYDNQGVAAYLFDWLKALHVMGKGDLAAPDWLTKCKERYGFHPIDDNLTGEEMLYKVADASCRGSPEDSARKMLQDFRNGRMGNICLQLAPLSEDDDGQQKVTLATERQQQSITKRETDWENERLARAAIAIKNAEEQGLELPPIVHATDDDDNNSKDEVGKGLFDGW